LADKASPETVDGFRSKNTPAVEGTSGASKPTRKKPRVGGLLGDILNTASADPSGNDAMVSSQTSMGSRPSSSQTSQKDPYKPEKEEKVLQKYAALEDQGGFSSPMAPPSLDSTEVAIKEVAKSMDAIMACKRVSL
jgi:hypothetical protein